MESRVVDETVHMSPVVVGYVSHQIGSQDTGNEQIEKEDHETFSDGWQ